MIKLKKFSDLKPFVIKNFIKNIFSWSELNNLLNLRPFVSSNRFHIINSPDKGYKWPNQSWLTDVNTFPPTLIKKIIKKRTCFLIDCSRVNKKVNDLCKNIEKITNMPTDAHIYFTLNKSNKSFNKHNDTSHNFILQIEGKTNFIVWQDENIILNENLNIGDLIYIPKLMYHQAISKSKRMSISFAFSDENNLLKQDREWINI
jgi:ribosomal protein L16 Arg81 hydroxylase